MKLLKNSINSSSSFQIGQNIIDINKLPNVPKLHFCIINLGNLKIDVEKKEDQTLEMILQNLQKNQKELRDCIFESIFYYDYGEKKKIKGADRYKKIFELNIPDAEVIYIKVNYIDNTPIYIQFIWTNNYYRKYIFKAGRKDFFHSVAMEFMGAHDEFINYIITRFYFYKPNNEANFFINTNQSINTINNEEQKQLYDIENEFRLSFETLEEIGIDDGTEILFEARVNTINSDKLIKINNYRKNYLEFSKLREQGFKLITFKSTKSNVLYPIIVNEKEKFEEAIFKLKREFPEFKNKQIDAASFRGDNLMKEEKSQSQIKTLGIRDEDFIVIHIKE